MNALLRALLGYGEPAPDAPPISPIENNPVGWSSTRAPDILTNPSPTVSPLVSAMLMTPEQKIGRFWNAANRQAKPAYTGADLPQLAAAGNEGMDAALGWAGMTTPTPKSNLLTAMEQMSMNKPTNTAWNPKEAASDIVKRLQDDGFKVGVQQGSGPVGPSVYLSITDPTTKRFLMKEVRISDHSTGAARFNDYHHVLGVDDIDSVFNLVRNMRARGPAADAAVGASAAASHRATEAEEVARRLSDGAAAAFPDEWAKWADKTGASAKKARNELRKRYADSLGKAGGGDP